MSQNRSQDWKTTLPQTMNITTTQKIENLDTKQTEQDKDANADGNISIEEESPRDLCNDNNRGCQFSLTRFFVQIKQFF